MCATTTLMPIPPLILDAYPAGWFKADHPEFGIDIEGRECLAIDSCIAPALALLWDAGIPTLGCCCGHGQSAGGIITLDTARLADRAASTPIKETYARIHADPWPKEFPE